MKRLNPATGRPFETGEMRADGMQFAGYDLRKLRNNGYYREHWRDAKEFNLITCMSDVRKRVRKFKLPFDIDRDYLRAILTTHCPIFNTPFNLGRMGEGYDTNNSPSLDRIIPEYGYVKGNVVFISNKANKIKQDVTEKEIYAVADWVHKKRKEVLNAFKDRPAPIPAELNQQSKNDKQLRFVFTAGAWQDDYDLNDYNRAIQWENAHSGAQESSGNSVDNGSAEMGTSQRFEDSQSVRNTRAKIGRARQPFERVRRKLGKLSMAAGTARTLRQFGD